MPEPGDRSTEDRLTRLEEAVERIQQSLDRLVGPRASRDAGGTTTPRVHPAPDRPPPPRAPRPPYRPPVRRAPEPGFFTTLFARGPEYWITRVGIGLLLVGVAFLFKYAVDQGWLTPWIRVVFGVALGGTLATIGFRVPRERRWFSQIMLGGAAATWYITGYAAFQLLELVSFPVAFGFMVLVTVFTFATAIRQNEAALAVLAAVGGLSTPFLLYTGVTNLPGLVGYTLLVLAGSSAIYFYQGWRSLLWITLVGGWWVLALGFGQGTGNNRFAAQLGLAGIWLLYFLIPTAREVLAERQPDRWPRPAARPWSQFGAATDPLGLGHLTVITIGVPLLAFVVTMSVWSVSDRVWGLVAIGVAALYLAAAGLLHSLPRLGILVSAHRITAAVFVLAAVMLLVTDSDLEIVLWAAVALGMLVSGKRLDDRGLRGVGHVLMGFVALWLAQRLVGDLAPNAAVFNRRALADAGVIAGGLAAASQLGHRETRAGYLLVAHGAILAWLWRELSVLPGGDGIVTTMWGVYGLGLLLLLKPARRLGLATMFLAVGKLILFDLSNVDALWRILLFLSFGAVFLALGYYVPALWRSDDEEENATDP